MTTTKCLAAKSLWQSCFSTYYPSAERSPNESSICLKHWRQQWPAIKSTVWQSELTIIKLLLQQLICNLAEYKHVLNHSADKKMQILFKLYVLRCYLTSVFELCVLTKLASRGLGVQAKAVLYALIQEFSSYSSTTVLSVQCTFETCYETIMTIMRIRLIILELFQVKYPAKRKVEWLRMRAGCRDKAGM